MLWEQFATLARDWMKRLPPAEARAALQPLLAEFGPRGLDFDEAIARALAEPAPAAKAESGAVPVPPGKAEPEIEPAPKRQALRESKKASSRTGKRSRGQPSERARALLRDQLKHGPKPADQIEAAAKAAAIPESALIAAADALGVRTQRGRWWLPGCRAELR